MQMFRHKIVFIFSLVLYLAVQGLMMTPHHHHGDTLPCFNTWHCSDERHHTSQGTTHHENDGCCDHSHHNGMSICDYKIDVVVETRQSNVPAPTETGDGLYALLPTITYQSSIYAQQSPDKSSLTEIDHGDIQGNVCVKYLIIAHTPRTDNTHKA